MSADQPNITQPSDFQTPSDLAPVCVSAEGAGQPRQPDLLMQTPAVIRLPHPNIWWALLWCVVLWITMVAGFVVGFIGYAVVVIGNILLRSNQLDSDVLQRAIASGINPQSAEEQGVLVAVVTLTAYVFIWALALITIRVFVGKGWTRRIALRLPKPVHVLLAILGLPGAIVLLGLLDQLTQKFIPSFVDLEQSVISYARCPLALGLLAIAVGPAIGEELWFRGFIGRGLVGRWGVVLGVIVTSLLFGVVHLEPRQIIYGPLLGAAFHFVYLTTRSLWVPMLLHFLTNGSSLMLVWLSEHGYLPANGKENSMPSPWALVLLSLGATILVIAVGWALHQTRTRVHPYPEEDGRQSWQPSFPGVECPPTGSGSILMCAH